MKSDNSRELLRPLKLSEQHGEKFSVKFPEIADMYRQGKTLPELVEYCCQNGNTYLKENPAVAIQSVRVGLALLIEQEELREIGKQHMRDTARQRALKAVNKRNQVPYHNKLQEINGQEFYEDEYISDLRKQNLTWEEITQLVNQVFESHRPSRTLRTISQSYHRWKNC